MPNSQIQNICSSLEGGVTLVRALRSKVIKFKSFFVTGVLDLQNVF